MNCLSNLNKCNAECCKVVVFKTADPRGAIGNTIVLDNMNLNMRRYYELHGFIIKRYYGRFWKVTIPRDIFKNVKVTYDYGHDKQILLEVPTTCSALTEDNKCKLHGTDEKPFCCNDLDKKTAHKYHITKNCILNVVEENGS